MGEPKESWDLSWLKSWVGFRMGPGVIGRGSTVALGAMLVFIVVALKTNVLWMHAAALLAAIAVFAGFFFSAQRFAKNNPQLALLEGSELLDLRKSEMAVQGQIKPEVPNVPAKQIIDVQAEAPNGK